MLRDRMSLLGMNMAQRSARRWLVAIIYLGLMLAGVLIWKFGGNHDLTLILLVTIVNGIIFGGYGRGGLIKPFATRTPFGSPTPWRNDERELRRRDRMHYHAYRFVVALLLLGYALGTEPFRHPQWGRALMLGGLVLGLTLPQALLLWSEPDMEFEESATPLGAGHAR
jgi:hypothetical protein